MARPDVWLSLEQLEYRADALQAAATHVTRTADEANKAITNSVTAVACLCATWTIRETADVFRQALGTAYATGGAPVSASAVDVFKLFHAVPAIRKDALAAKAGRKAYDAEQAAKDAARADAAAQRSTATKRRRRDA